MVEGLRQRGHAVQLIRPRQSHEAPAPRAGLEQVLSHGIPVPTYGELRFGLPSKGRLVKLWAEQRPDIVHVVTEGPLGWSAVTAARKLALPLSSSFHTNFHSYSQHYRLGLLKSPIESYLRKLHNRTQATMVPTHAMQQELQGRGYDNVTLVSRGVAIEQFKPERRSEALRASWGAQPDDPVVILVGRLAKEKNVNLLVSAYQAIKTRLPRARLVLVGDGPLRSALQAQVPEAHFVGIRQGEDLAAHYASGDLFLFPSLTETFGNVVPEALASGLALLSYANAAALELIRDQHNGLLVPSGDTQAFVQAAVALALDPALQQRLRQAASPSVSQLAWSAVSERFEQVLREVLARHGQPHGESLGAAGNAALAPQPRQRISAWPMRS
jgi:glycosyltransferase involved in cell wall biosynthesis